jgi:hypothetical protein
MAHRYNLRSQSKMLQMAEIKKNEVDDTKPIQKTSYLLLDSLVYLCNILTPTKYKNYMDEDDDTTDYVTTDEILDEKMDEIMEYVTTDEILDERYWSKTQMKIMYNIMWVMLIYLLFVVFYEM